MKYTNRHKRAWPHWHPVKSPKIEMPAPPARGKMYNWFWVMPAEKERLKHWCQQQSSTGRFAYDDLKHIWYFEFSEDATWFALNYG